MCTHMHVIPRKTWRKKKHTAISEPPQKRAATTLHKSIDRSVVWIGPQMTINDDIPLKFPGCTWSPVCRPGGLHEWCPSHGGLPKQIARISGSNKKTTSTTSAFCSGVSFRPNKNCGSKKTT